MSRIYQYPVVTEIGSDDYLALGSATNGSRAILASDLAPVIGSKTITERGTYKASDDNMDGYGQVTVDIPYTDIHVASGDIATFEGEDLPLKSLKVTVTPYQDLHGYDGPWAGGAGKNKCGEFELGTLSESSAQGSTYDNMKVSNTARIRSKTLIEIPSTCTISCANGYKYAFAGYDSNMEYLGVYQFYTWRSEAYTFDNSTIKYIAIIIKRDDEGNIQSNDYTNCHIQLESGNQATSYAPYSNICPIIGWSEADVTRTGKNLWGYGNVSGTKQVDVEVDIPIGSFDFSCEITSADVDGTTSLIIFYYDDDTSFLTRLNRNTRVSYTFTATKHIKKVSFYAGYNSNQSAGDTFAFANIQLELGSTPSAYSPYNGATYTIDLNGTRYGGTLDATNGTMDDTLDHIASYNGEALPSTWISDRDVYAEGTTPTIGAEVVYTRATPITVQLAPTPAKSIEGENNIFANCGAVDVEYQTVWVRPTN